MTLVDLLVYESGLLVAIPLLKERAGDQRLVRHIRRRAKNKLRRAQRELNRAQVEIDYQRKELGLDERKSDPDET